MLPLAEALLTNQGKGIRYFRFHKTAKRVAKRFGPSVARQWLKAVTRTQAGISEKALQVALTAKNMAQVEKIVTGTPFGQLLQGIENPLRGTIQAAGTASANVLNNSGFPIEFNAVHPNVVKFARDQSADLVVKVTKDVKEAVRIVVATGASQGLTVVQQARAIRQTVGLPPNWAKAPLNLADDIRNGRAAAATSRRLSAIDKAQIRKRIREGTVNEAFVKKMQGKYTASLINRRGLNIAATETLRSAHFGQNDSWAQAIQQGSLSPKSRKFWLPTPDERLSEEHARIPGMNPKGRKIDEDFVTTEGNKPHPPSRPNCRCGMGLGAVAGTGRPRKAPKKSMLPPTGVGGGAGEAGGGVGAAGFEAAERAAREAAERVAREAAERAAREAAEKAAKEKIAKEAAERAAKEEAKKKLLEKWEVKKALKKAAAEKAAREAAEKAAREAAEKAAKEEAERVAKGLPARVVEEAPEEIRERLNSRFAGYQEKLTADEISALRDYQGVEYSDINALLRRRGVGQEKMAAWNEHVQYIDSAINKAPTLGKETTFWRGGKFSKEMIDGDTFTDYGYVSTSGSRGIGETFFTDVYPIDEAVLFRTTMGPKQKGVWMQAATNQGYELEFVLPRGTQFRVISEHQYSFAEYRAKFGKLPDTTMDGDWWEDKTIRVVELVTN